MIRVLFIGDFPNLTYVDVENQHGQSVCVGQWVKEDDYWVLEIESCPDCRRLYSAVQTMVHGRS